MSHVKYPSVCPAYNNVLMWNAVMSVLMWSAVVSVLIWSAMMSTIYINELALIRHFFL